MFFFILARPSVLQQPTDVTILVTDLLSVVCRVSAKPGATITWIYGSNGSPDTSVLEISPSTQPSGLYTVTTSELSWTPADSDMRKTVNGVYKCTASNGYGDVTSQTMALNVQCEYTLRLYVCIITSHHRP